MKKIFLFVFLLCNQIVINAQIDTLKIGKLQFAISGNTYSFFQTVGAATWNRSVYIYPKQTVYKNLPVQRAATARLQAFQLFRDVTRVSTVTPIPGRLSGNCRGRVWLANTDSIDFTNVVAWSQVTRIFRPSLVFDGDIKAIADSTSGWKTFPITPQFPLDTSKNLLVVVEYVQDAPTIDQVFWAYDSTTVMPNDVDTINYFSRLQFRFCHQPFSRSPTPVDTFTGSNIRHPSLRLIVNSTTKVEEKENLIKDLQIFPNPTQQSDLQIAFSIEKTTILEGQVTDVLGRLIWSEKRELLRGSQNFVLHLPHNLAKGFYFLTLKTGKIHLTKTFLKN
jgi:hypothetical protein